MGQEGQTPGDQALKLGVRGGDRRSGVGAAHAAVGSGEEADRAEKGYGQFGPVLDDFVLGGAISYDGETSLAIRAVHEATAREGRQGGF
jgi:hypothetical protein